MAGHLDGAPPEPLDGQPKVPNVSDGQPAGGAISAGDNRKLVASQAKDNALLTPLELTDHVSPEVAAKFHKDPVNAMLEIYSKGLTRPNETPEEKDTRLQREAACKTRLAGLQRDDPKLFGDIVRIGEQIASNQLSPAQAGQEVGAAVKGMLERARAANGGNEPDFNDQIGTGLVALSSTMLAERGTFADSHDVQKTRAMVDAVEAVLRQNGAGDLLMAGPDNKLLPAQLHGVTWANDGEPAICGWTTDGQKDRYKFEINL